MKLRNNFTNFLHLKLLVKKNKLMMITLYCVVLKVSYIKNYIYT